MRIYILFQRRLDDEDEVWDVVGAYKTRDAAERKQSEDGDEDFYEVYGRDKPAFRIETHILVE